jgi:hypothetical protein
MQKTLSEKELAHALFFAIKHNDLEHAYQLVKMGAPVQTAFYLTQDAMAYTSSSSHTNFRLLGRKGGRDH